MKGRACPSLPPAGLRPWVMLTHPVNIGNLCCWPLSSKRKGCCISRISKVWAIEIAEATASSIRVFVSYSIV